MRWDFFGGVFHSSFPRAQGVMTAAWLIWCDSALSSLMSSDLSDSDWCDHYSVNVIVFFFRGGWHTGILLIVKKSGQPCWYGEHWYVCLLYIHLKNPIQYSYIYPWFFLTTPNLSLALCEAQWTKSSTSLQPKPHGVRNWRRVSFLDQRKRTKVRWASSFQMGASTKIRSDHGCEAQLFFFENFRVEDEICRDMGKPLLYSRRL